MRDLATYECNYSEEIAVRGTLMRLYKVVSDNKTRIERIQSQKCSNHHYLDDKVIDKFLQAMGKVREA